MKRVIRFLLACIFLFSVSGCFAGAEELISHPTYKVRMEFGVLIPMRDTVNLSADIYFPDADGKFPSILIRTPYGKSVSRYDRYGKFYASRGYAVCIQDCRGRFESEGAFSPFAGEEYDGFDSIEWLARQAWSNGKVGMTGVSYLGFVQWMAATEQPPHLSCIFAYGSPSDMYGDTWFSSGTLWLVNPLTWAFMMHSRTNQNIAVHDWVEFKEHLPLMTMDEALGRKIGFWKEWLSHPNDDDYWNRRGMKGKFGKINVPSISVTGWYDNCLLGSVKNYIGVMREGTEFARENARLIIGYWPHSGPYPHTENYFTKLGDFDFGHDALFDLESYELRWFDFWLKGYPNNIMKEPRVKLFILGENEWETENEWPSTETKFTDFYFHSGGSANTLFGDGRLDKAAPGSEPPDKYTYDPAEPVPSIKGKGARGGISSEPSDQRINEKRMDVLCYTSEVLKQDMKVIGPVKIVLFASSSAVDTDFCGKLVDVHPNGAAYNLGYPATGILSARFRDSLASPSPIKPGKIYRYEIELRSVANVFKKGHRIRVEISSSDFPVYNRNLNTGENPYTSTNIVKANQIIYHSAEYTSHIVLPVID